MFNFIRYILRYELKKVTTWLIPIFGIILYCICSWFLLYIFNQGDKQFYSFIEKGNIYSFLIIFAFSSIFVGIKSIAIFSSSQETGEEVILSSKPVIRIKQTFSKFISLWILILFISFLFFIASLIVSSFDHVASYWIKINYSFSILIGNFIICLIISAFTILLSQHAPIKLTLITTFSVSIILPIMSLILTTATRKGIIKDNAFEKYLKAPKELLSSSNSDGFSLVDDSENAIYGVSPKTRSIMKNNKDYYSSFAYLDLWQQFSSLYSLTYKNYSSLSIKKWDISKTTLNSSNNASLKMKNGKNYSLIIKDSVVYSDSQEINQENWKLLKERNSKGYDQLKNLFKNIINNKNFSFNKDSLIKQLIYIHRINKEFNENNINADINNINTIGTKPNAKMKDKELAILFKDVTLIDFLIWDMLPSLNIGFTPSNFLGWNNSSYTSLENTDSLLFKIVFIESNKEMVVALPRPYVNKVFLYIFWIFITIGFTSLTFWKSNKKDFF
ncbi:MAG: hypothetical protein GY679_05090 [Mycoplasma sp.]|nr:hypothetical protein [Mycoplasma sp.]